MARTTKKTKVKETEYEVISKDTSPGSKVTATAKNVNAISADAALKAANPTGVTPGSAEEITVRKKDPRATMNPNKQGVLAETKLPTKAALGRAQYPYRLGLPGGFASLIETAGLSYLRVGDTIVLRFDDANILHETLTRISKSEDRRASVIIDGVKRSI